MLRWVFFAVCILIFVGTITVATLQFVGWLLPQSHHATRSVVLAAPPETVFRVIADVAHAASWRSDVCRIEDATGPGLGMTFREVGRRGTVPYRVVGYEPGRRFVTRIADHSLPYGGTWTFDLEPDGRGTKLTISEDGEVYNPILRFLARLFFSPTATIERYQADLAKNLSARP